MGNCAGMNTFWDGKRILRTDCRIWLSICDQVWSMAFDSAVNKHMGHMESTCPSSNTCMLLE